MLLSSGFVLFQFAYYVLPIMYCYFWIILFLMCIYRLLITSDGLAVVWPPSLLWHCIMNIIMCEKCCLFTALWYCEINIFKELYDIGVFMFSFITFFTLMSGNYLPILLFFFNCTVLESARCTVLQGVIALFTLSPAYELYHFHFNVIIN